MRGILGRILLVAGVLGIAHQVALVAVPHWFARSIAIPMTAWDPISRTASYVSGPFHVGVRVNISALVPGPGDALVIDESGNKREVSAQVGRELTLGDETFTVSEVAPWTGLMSDPNGEPMIQVSFQQGDDVWVNDLQLSERTEVRVGELAVNFDTDSNTTPEPPQPRWGIADDGNVIWFDDLVQGAGYETSDGTVYTLTGYRQAQHGEPLTIGVIAQSPGGDPIRHVITPDSDHPVIKLEAPAADALRFIIRPINAFDVAGTLYRGTEELERVELLPGFAVSLVAAPFRVRLDQYEPTSVPVTKDASVIAVTLVKGDRRVVVRQGVAARVGDAGTLWYKLDPSLANVTFTVESSALDAPLVLESGDAVFTIPTDIGAYRVTPGAAMNLDPLPCQFTPRASLGVVIASIFMLISGGAFTMLAYRELSSER